MTVELPPRPQDLPIWNGDDLIPRFMYEDYPDAVPDAVELLRSVFFWREWNKDPGNIESTKEMVERLAVSKMQALIHTGNLQSNMQDALTFQLHDADVNKWHLQIGDGIPEIGTMAELISIATQKEHDKNPDGGMFYEYRKVLQMLKVLEQTAMRAAKKGGLVGEKAKERVSKQIMSMITTPSISSKIRESGSVVEHILTSNASEVSKVELVEEVFNDVLSEDVPFLKFRERNRQRMGKAGKTVLPPVPGDVYLLGNQEIIVIESRSPSQTRAIESKLNGMVTTFTPKAGTEMITRLESLVMFKGTHQEYLHSKEKGFYEHPDGVRMPTPETFYKMAQDIILKSREIIDQYIKATNEPLWILIERISSGVSKADLHDYLSDIFHTDLKNLDDMTFYGDLNQMYKLSPDINMLWPKAHKLVWLDARSNDFGLYVEMRK